jgi:2-amino-4-hydroxy-6-hydroxymethyldihydropteridine diphosphokinase
MSDNSTLIQAVPTQAVPTQAVLGLGSNMGDKRAMIAKAIAHLQEAGLVVIKRSHDYRAPPWGPVQQDWYINACVLVETTLSAEDLLIACQYIEQDMGRHREIKWGPRIIDIDIITYGRDAMDLPHLTVPHRHVLERAFVLVPLFEICPMMKIGDVSIAQALLNVSIAEVVRVEG